MCQYLGCPTGIGPVSLPPQGRALPLSYGHHISLWAFAPITSLVQTRRMLRLIYDFVFPPSTRIKIPTNKSPRGNLEDGEILQALCRGAELNCRPVALQANALPLSYPGVYVLYTILELELRIKKQCLPARNRTSISGLEVRSSIH